MTVPLRSRSEHDLLGPPSGPGGARRWWREVAAVLIGAALLAAGLLVLFDRGPVVDDEPSPDTQAPTLNEGQEPRGDGPLTHDEPGRDEPDAGETTSLTIRYGDEARANWDVTSVDANDVLNVRSGPGITYPIIATLAHGAVELESTGRIADVGDQRWREIIVPADGVGWVNAAYLTGHQPTPAPGPSPDPAPAQMPASLRGAEWSQVPTTQKVVALTFDAGANADGVPSILSTLQATGTPATFFLTGRWTEQYPELARDIASRHPVGNHSVTHPSFTTLTDAELRDEVLGAEATIEEVTGSSTRPLFRFPYGDRDARTIRLVNEEGYGSFRWTVDTLGWKGTSAGMTAATVVDRVTDTARPGQIVLLHVGSHPSDRSTLDADALPQIIEQLQTQGYRFITLTEALTIDD